MTFTGPPPIALAVSTASITKSRSPRRPNPPPRSVVWIVTRSGGSPVRRPAISSEPPGFWVGIHIVHASAVTWAVAFIGSMHACSRYGTW